MSKLKPVTIREFLNLIDAAQQIHQYRGEPIPLLSPENKEQVESCLKSPFQTFGKVELYSSFIEKASILFYLLIKNHPLQNGNKRMACLSASYFADKNGHDFLIKPERPG